MQSHAPSNGTISPRRTRTVIAAAAALLMLVPLMAGPAAAEEHHPQVVDAWNNYFEGATDGLFVRWSTEIAGNPPGGIAGYTVHEAADCTDAAIATGDVGHWLPDRPTIRDLVLDTPAALTEGGTYYLGVASGTERTVVDGSFVYSQEECFAFVAELRAGFGGRVTDTVSGDPISDATVTVFDGAGVEVAAQTTVVTSPDPAEIGRYRIEGLPAGTYDVTASADGYGSQTQSVTLEPGFLEDVNFALQPVEPGAIAGTVTDADGGAIQGATVTADGESATTAADGTYTIGGLNPGEHTVTADADGFESANQTVTVNEGQTAAADFALDAQQVAGTGSVAGTVTDADGGVVESATLTVDGQSATTGADGTYTIGDVAVGEHTVTAAADGFESATQTVTVVAGETTTADFSLAAVSGGGLEECPVVAPDAGFDDQEDIPDVHVGNVNCAAALEIVEGFVDGEYKPRLPVTRAQMASYIFRTLRAADIDLPAATGDRFSDVGEGSAHDESIHRLAAADIVQGGPVGLDAEFYGPQLRTRRDQMGSFLMRAAGYALHGDPNFFDDGGAVTDPFPDVPASNVHFDNVHAARDFGIALGFEDGTYRPAATTRRDQMASFVIRLLNVILEEGPGEQGTITGTVTDASGAPIETATVTADGASDVTGTDGTYSITGLAPGEYVVTADAEGFATETATATVTAGETTTVEFTLGVDLVVAECGEQITEDTTLGADVGPCPGHGLIIAADGVTLDLNGHTVSGDPVARAGGDPTAPGGRDRAGVLFRQSNGSTLVGSTITGFDAGVAIMGGGNNTVQGLTLTDNINYRVITGVDADPVEGTPECLFGEGLVMFNSTGNTIEGNILSNNGPLSGIALVGNSDDNTIVGNTLSDHDVANVTRDGDPRNTICGTGGGQGPMTRGRTFQDIGVRVEGPGAQSNLVQANDVARSAIAGIGIHGYVCGTGGPAPVGENNGSNVVNDNTVTETGLTSHMEDSLADGIAALQQGPAGTVCVSHSNTITNNTSSGNFRDGIFVGGRGTDNNVISNNVVNDNARHGISLTGPGNNLPGAIDNVLHDNQGAGNGGFDGADFNLACDNNEWLGNVFGTVNQPCVRGPDEPAGLLSGTVTDNTDSSPIAGAQVSVTDGVETQTVLTDAAGEYGFQLSPGDYTVDASALGYVDSAPQMVTVTDGGVTTVDFALDLAPISATLTVTDVAINTPGDLDVRWSEEIHPQMVGVAADYTIHATADCSGDPIGIGDHHHGHGATAMDRELVINGEGEARDLLTAGVEYYLTVAEAAEFGTVSDALNALVDCQPFTV